jgi:hypothetical protein
MSLSPATRVQRKSQACKEREMCYLNAAILTSVVAGVIGPSLTWGAEPGRIAPDQFDKLHRMIHVQPDEQRFWRIPWKLTISEAREQAAKEGKPIFVWAGAGGAPIGVC